MTGLGTAFRLEGVSLRYPSGTRPALERVDLRIAQGEAVAFVGPSGSGKTTLLRLLNASLRPTTGRVLTDGTDVASRDAHGLRRLRSGIGFVHQDLGLLPNARAITNVLCGRLGRQSFAGAVRSLLWPSRAERRDAHAILERVGIGELLYQRVDRLSGGQRQRIAIARALYQEPGALLADEPVSSVDPARARDTLELLLDLGRESGFTLCVSLHDLELARALFPRLVGLRRGAIAFDRPTGQVHDDELSALFELEPNELVEEAR